MKTKSTLIRTVLFIGAISLFFSCGSQSKEQGSDTDSTKYFSDVKKLITGATLTETCKPGSEIDVYLKNQSIKTGTLIEQVQGVSIKVNREDGSIASYKMGEIYFISKITDKLDSSALKHTKPEAFVKSRKPGETVIFYLSDGNIGEGMLIPGDSIQFKHISGEYRYYKTEQLRAISKTVTVYRTKRDDDERGILKWVN